MGVLTGRGNRDKYQGSYENVAKAIQALLQVNAPHNQLQQFFDYVALMVMVRNGDGHLKSFGLLYENPQESLPSIQLAPLYDVVTTSIYDLSGRHDPYYQVRQHPRPEARQDAKLSAIARRCSSSVRQSCQVMHPQRTIRALRRCDVGRL